VPDVELPKAAGSNRHASHSLNLRGPPSERARPPRL
jgi:hypothetical protein